MFPIQPSFTAGELAPSLYARTDLSKYAIGARTLKNFFCHGHGGASNRPGTRFVCECPVAETGYTEIHRLIPFQFSVEQGYILEFSHLLIRVIKDGVLVEDGGAPVEIVTPYINGQLYDIDYAQSADVLFLVHGDHPPMKLSRTSDVDWTLEEVAFVDGPYATRGPGDEKITLTPDGQTGTVIVTASEDFFYNDMVGGPLRLGYPDTEDPTDIDWGWGIITAVNDSQHCVVEVEDPFGYELIFNGDFATDTGGWEDHSTESSELEYDPAGPYAVLTVTSDGYGLMAQEVEYFHPKVVVRLTVEAIISVGGQMRVQAGKEPNGSTYLKQTVDTSGVHEFEFTTPPSSKTLYISIDNRYGVEGDTVQVQYVSLVRADMTTSEWRTAAWGPGWGRGFGYPQRITFFEQRLCFSTTYAHPQTVWMSMTGNFYNFSFASPGADDDSISYTLASREINAIMWMASSTELILGTYSTTWKISAGGQTDVVTPTSITARVQSGEGCAPLAPLQIGDSLLFIQRGNRSVRDLAYSLQTDSFQGKDLSIMAAHLFENRRITSWDYAALHDSVVWCVGDDGMLLGMTYLPAHEVTGWHRHETDGEFVDVCVLPGTESDEVYFLVKRTYRGGASLEQRFYVEKMMPRITLGKGAIVNEREGIDRLIYEGLGQSWNYFFVDCGVIYEGTTETNVLGLDHLENYEVAILADGSVLPRQTVTDGMVVLERPAERVIVGLPYESMLETLNIEVSDDKGSGTGRIKAISRVTLKIHQTRGGEVGPRGIDQWDQLDELRVRDVWDGNDPIALRTGDLSLVINAGWEQAGGLTIRNRDPLPITILGIIPEVQLADR